MTLRRHIKKWLYGYCPGFAGAFPYFGNNVYFPSGSESFEEVCRHGIFELDNVRFLQTFAKKGSVVFDVGGHLGLMAIPVLNAVEGVRVISFEPSPNSWPYLERTACASRFRDRWEVVRRAVSGHPGRASFSTGPENRAFYDGLRPTGRAQNVGSVEVDVTTIDKEWRDRGEPYVSVIKINVEGGELDVLKGARDCLRRCRPVALVEWWPANFRAYGCVTEDLLTFCQEEDYFILSAPYMAPVPDGDTLAVTAKVTDSFLLFPASRTNGKHQAAK